VDGSVELNSGELDGGDSGSVVEITVKDHQVTLAPEVVLRRYEPRYHLEDTVSGLDSLTLTGDGLFGDERKTTTKQVQRH